MNQENEKYILQSVANTLDILDLLGNHAQLTVPEISSLTGLSKSSVFRMLATLESRGYVRKSPNARFHLGLKLIGLGARAQESLDVARIGHPFLTDLTSKTGETSHMAVLDQDFYVRFVDKVLSHSTIRTDSAIGFRRRAHLVSCGKVMLAHLRPDQIDAYIQNVSLEPLTEYSITSGEALREELSQIRRQGFAFDRQESEYGLFCMAAPVSDYSGNVVAAISVSGPVERMKRSLEIFLPLLLNTAEQISQVLS